MRWISFFLLSSAVFVNAAFSVYKPRVIYGEDNRIDLYQVKDQGLYKVARSTAAIFPRTSIVQEGNHFKILSKVFGKEFQLCAGEPFADQPSGAQCSAFLVSENLMATAGHCVNTQNCSSTAFVFNYAMHSEGVAPAVMDQDDVYFCERVMKREQTAVEDYALVKLDRPVRGYEPLKMAREMASVNDPLVVIGHPSGIPTKVSGGASVRSRQTGFFMANLDTYGGNSGSAVFNAETLEVLGILVRGEKDFAYDIANSCYRSNRCQDTGCRGEDVTHISYIREAMGM